MSTSSRIKQAARHLRQLAGEPDDVPAAQTLTVRQARAELVLDLFRHGGGGAFGRVISAMPWSQHIVLTGFRKQAHAVRSARAGRGLCGYWVEAG